jgi:hypothetical protein
MKSEQSLQRFIHARRDTPWTCYGHSADCHGSVWFSIVPWAEGENRCRGPQGDGDEAVKNQLDRDAPPLKRKKEL